MMLHSTNLWAHPVLAGKNWLEEALTPPLRDEFQSN